MAELGKLREQAATGLRLNRSSDAPALVPAALSAGRQIKQFETYLDNIKQARATLDIGVSTLQEVSDLLNHARQLGLEAAQSSNGPTSLEALATELDMVIDQMLRLANAKHEGRYLFSGAATQMEPFAVAERDGSGRPSRIVYQGSELPHQVDISQASPVTTLMPGSHVLQSRQRLAVEYLGSTGAQPGAGTDSATGLTKLQIRHVATSYEPGSGVKPGLNSAEGDTIIGPNGAHVLTIVDTSGDGSSGTVSLDGGPAVQFTSADTNLRVEGPHGEVVYVDTTQITPGFSGDVAITASGAMSIDGGATEVPIDFSENQVVEDSETGRVVNVNTQEVRSTGIEYIDHKGAYDVFEALISLRDAIRNVADLPPKEQADFISSRVAELERARERILDAMGEQSAALASIESTERWMENLKVETEKFITELAAADIAEVIIRIRDRESLLQLTLAATARMLEADLGDFLR